MKKSYQVILFTAMLLATATHAQVVTTSPTFPKADQPVTITVDVSGTSLDHFAWNNTSNPVWIWSWIAEGCASNCDAPTNINPATAAADAAKVTRISTNPDKYQITFTPTTFFNKSKSELLKIGLKLKTRDWNDGKQTDNDRLIEFTDGFDISFSAPAIFPIFKNTGDQLQITANASEAADLSLKVNNVEVASASSATTISYTHNVTETSGSSTVTLDADNGTEVKSISFDYIIRTTTVEQARPEGVIDGINYGDDDTKVVLSVLAPGKTSAYVMGDFTDWEILPQYQMKKDGEHFWIELTGLTAGVEYAYQYFIGEEIRIGDPYADKILDPDDQYIPAATYPDLKTFPEKARSDKWYFNRLSVFQTGQTSYNWTTTNFEGPAREDMVVYELHIRDFFADGKRNYQTLIDTIGYFKRLGINAIELMPITEFNGNDSWGYNPTFMFAPDKYYGTKDKLKEFIDRCHAEGIAVILDIVMNQQDLPNAYVLMDYDFTAGKPQADNRWFNVNATHPFNVFFDMNHESTYTKDYLDTVNYYWLNEYKVDGFRFDLSKGFTQTNNPNNTDAWSAKDDSRIAILKRMADKIWEHTPDAMLILEHLAVNEEEKILADYGFMLWGNINHNFIQNTMGYAESSDVTWASYKSRNWSDPNLIAYMESHDEERMMFKNLSFGNSAGTYSVKNENTALDRVKAAATYFFSIPGPKMIWQFGELGYDISIDVNGRTGAKPVKWEYYSDPEHKSLYDHFSQMIGLKKTWKVFETTDFSMSGGSTLLKQITLKNDPYTETPVSEDEMNVQVAVNFDITAKSISVNFPHTGQWYNYFDGQVVNVTAVPHALSLPPGAYRLFTDFQINPVTGVGHNIETKYEIFPNPATDNLLIRKKNSRILRVRFLNMQGTTGELNRINSDIWDVSSLPAGLYILSIQTSNGMSKLKFIKSK